MEAFIELEYFSPPHSSILNQHLVYGPVIAVLLLVLQFVPQSVDTGFCNFTQRIEKGLMIALSEVRKHHQGTHNFTVQVRIAPNAEQGALSFEDGLISRVSLRPQLTLTNSLSWKKFSSHESRSISFRGTEFT